MRTKFAMVSMFTSALLHGCIVGDGEEVEEAEEVVEEGSSDDEAEVSIIQAQVGGLTVTTNEAKWLKFISANVVNDLVTYYGNRNTALDRAAVVAWWSLKEGVLNLSNPIAYSNCNSPKPNTHISAFATCPAGVAWQVGLSGVQVRYHTAAEFEAAARGANPGMSTNQLLAEAAAWGGVSASSVTGSSGILRQSWLARIPSGAFIVQYPTVASECLSQWKSWCDGRYTSNQSAARSVIAGLRSYFDSASMPPTGTPLCPSGRICDSIALVAANRQWTVLHNAVANSPATRFAFGGSSHTVVMGDWNCDGIKTPGVFNRSSGLWQLRNANSGGAVQAEFYFGVGGDTPLVGDWNGDGCDTVAVHRPSTGQFFYRNTLTPGAATAFSYGNPADKPFVGDWNGDGRDTMGLHRPSTGQVFLRNSNTSGVADITFTFGNPADQVFAGDWDGNGTDTVGVYRPSTGRVHLRNANSEGVANYSFTVGGYANVIGAKPR